MSDSHADRPSSDRRGTGSSRQFPLRFVLIVPSLLQIAIAVGLTGYFSWRNGQKTVESLAMRLSREVTAHIEKHVLSFADLPSQFVNINEAAIRVGNLDPSDFRTMARYFWRQTQFSDAVPFVFFGNPQGEFVGVWQEDDNLTTFMLKDSSTAPNREIYYLDRDGQPGEIIQKDLFDPRVRPWYRAAIAAGQPTWSPIYVWAAVPRLGIDRVAPVYDDSGALAGVLAAAVTLTDISDFLKQLEASESGQIFMIERSGEIVASSVAEPPFRLTEAGEQRLAALDSSEPLIREAARSLLDRFGSFDRIIANEQFVFEISGQRQFIQTIPFNTQRGIDWLIIVVIPETDFMDYIRSNTYTTMLLCLGALVVAAGLGVATSQWIARPVLRLSRASQSLAERAMDTDFGNEELVSEEDIGHQTIQELGILAGTFSHMAQQLRLAFNTMNTANAELERRVADRTRELELANQELQRFVSIDGLTQVANRRRFDEYLQQSWRQHIREQQSLSLILCDVDYFKLYNDTYGHQAGDECLKQIAAVMRATICRPIDLVARYGGEEFAVVLPQTDLDGASQVAEKIRQQVKQLDILHASSGISPVVTISLGVSACSPAQHSLSEALLTAADRALYRSKTKGRDRVTAIPCPPTSAPNP
ncbi:MAG: diguanylate cyclase [Cyanobacteria bacterium P01_F01_bin.33]